MERTFEECLFPRKEGDTEAGWAHRKIDPEKFVKREIKPIPAHFRASILAPGAVLQHLRNQFLFTDPVKFAKVKEALENFKVKEVDWNDFV